MTDRDTIITAAIEETIAEASAERVAHPAIGCLVMCATLALPFVLGWLIFGAI